MDWRNKIALLEESNDWKGAVQLFEKSDSKEPELYLRVMFLLLDLLVEGQYSQDEQSYASEKIREIYLDANSKFSENVEFLFFSGIMIYIAEWYFGMDTVEPANSMLEKAMKKEPDNTLFKWGYYSRIDQRPEQNTLLKLELSEQLLFKEPCAIDWLKSKGLLGKYVLGTLEGTYEDLKEEKASI